MSMSDIDILHQMIRDAAKISVSEEYGRKKVELTEPQHSDSKATISGLPDNVIVIKADAFKSPDTVFGGSLGECKRADFVIVSDTGKKKVIICIEMKSAKGKFKEIVQQLKGAKCFVLFCQEIGREFWNQPNFLKGYRFRFVQICYTTSISKKPTRPSNQSGLHDRPDRMLKIDSPHHLEFNHLAGA